MTIGVDRFAPNLGVLGSGVFECRFLHLIAPAPFATAPAPPLATTAPVVAIPIKPLPAAPALPVTSIVASSPHLRLANSPAMNNGTTASNHMSQSSSLCQPGLVVAALMDVTKERPTAENTPQYRSGNHAIERVGNHRPEPAPKQE